MHKYLSFNVIKYIKLERLTKLNKNINEKIMLIFSFLIDFYIKLDIRLLLIFENKTIILQTVTPGNYLRF